MLFNNTRKKIIFLLKSLFFWLLIFLLFFWLYNRYCYDNFHVVVPGIIYRSAQLNAHELEKYNQKFHFKSMLNLCGVHSGSRWYEVEEAFAAAHQWHYVSIRFNAHKLPSKEVLRALVNFLETAPKPLIFHCTQGADRTGMAAAISLILFDQTATIDQIERQASWHYNALSPETVGYQVLRNYFAWLKIHHEMLSRQTFFAWLNSDEPMVAYHGWFL